MSGLIVETGAGPMSGVQLAEPVKRRLQHAREARKSLEPGWHSNIAFAANKPWLKWDRFSRSLVMPPDLREKDLYSADVITEYRTTVLGELGSDDDRPELLLRRDDAPSEDYQGQVNRAVAYGWDQEWDGDEALSEARRLCIDLGTSAVRCRWDPATGPMLPGDVPHLDGQPVLDPQKQYDLFQGGPNPQVAMQQMRQGKICWEPLSAFNLLVPPGVPHERYFPWECIVRPVLLSKVQEEYGAAAADLKEDTDIGSVYGETFDSPGSGANMTLGGGRNRLRDHVWLYTYLERPTGQFPQGRTVILAGTRLLPLKFDNRLPYQAPDGTYRSGLAYFHWWRVTGRFWSRGLVENMKDVQRGINKRRTQQNEIIDRGMPYVIVEKDSAALDREGTPVEFIELRKGEAPPQPVAGVAPGPWMQADVESMREDLEHATGVKSARLGENPANVNTYSQLALINENDQIKREPILVEHKRSIAQLVEDSVYDIRTYWGPQRQIQLAGDEDQIDAELFDATKIPPFFIVKVAKGSAKPRSQAAELKKIEDIWTASINAGQPLPVSWLKESLDAGQALDLPESPTDDQAEKAELENHLMMQGQPVEVDYFDPPGTHIPLHRNAQIQARLSGEQPTFDLIEEHVQKHYLAAQANAAQIAQTAPPAPQPAPAPASAPAPSNQ